MRIGKNRKYDPERRLAIAQFPWVIYLDTVDILFLTTKPHQNLKQEIYDWGKEQFGPCWTSRRWAYGSNKPRLYFMDKNDAIAFKLVWTCDDPQTVENAKLIDSQRGKRRR